MGWFSDLTGIDTKDFIKMTAGGGDPTAIATTAAAAKGTSNAFGDKKDPTALALNQGVNYGVGALKDIAFDEQGNLRIPEYRAPGDVSQNALNALLARSQNDPMQALSERYYTDVLGGAQNPYLQAQFKQAAGDVRSALDSQFERAGRYGGSEHEMAVGGALSDLATNIYGGAYESDMARRERAAQMAPDVGYQGLTRQLGYGQLQDQLASEAANYDYTAGMDAVNQYLQSLGVARGGYVPQQQRNKLAEGLSVITSLASLAGGNPLPALATAAGSAGGGGGGDYYYDRNPRGVYGT